MIITQLTQTAKLFLASCLKEGDVVVDATLGNGMDTLFLREQVGDSGKVYAFDIQPLAMERSRKRLPKQMQSNVEWILDTHAKMKDYVHEKVQAVIFNLGYLPESDHMIKTHWGTTRIALEQALHLLLSGGLIVISAYIGHDGGEEYRGVEAMMRKLDARAYKVIEVNPLNQSSVAPKLLICQKVMDIEQIHWKKE